jgi:hypothetical protein
VKSTNDDVMTESSGHGNTVRKPADRNEVCPGDPSGTPSEVAIQTKMIPLTDLVVIRNVLSSPEQSFRCEFSNSTAVIVIDLSYSAISRLLHANTTLRLLF